MNPHNITEQFEKEFAKYCGAPYCIATTSCTMAILIACSWFKQNGYAGDVSMVSRSYIGVPASIKTAGFNVTFRDENWAGEYRLDPLPLYDSARRTRRGMYRKGMMQCTSHHWSKIMSVGQMGCILHDDPEADIWMRKCRFDGRSSGVPVSEDDVIYPSYHAYLSPEVAAYALMKLSLLPDENDDLPWDNYPNLSKLGAFK